MNVNEKIIEWKAIYDYIHKLIEFAQHRRNMCFYSEDAMWNFIYDIVFSDVVNGRLQQLHPFNYPNIDASYEEDVCDWLCGLNMCYENEIKILLEVND